MGSRSYKDLIVWQKALLLVKEIYALTEHFPQSENFGLTSQMQRSAMSIPMNIAEGSKRTTKKDFRKYVHIAYGSGAELETQIEIAKQLPFTSTLDFRVAESLLDEVMRMLNGLAASLIQSTKLKTTN